MPRPVSALTLQKGLLDAIRPRAETKKLAALRASLNFRRSGPASEAVAASRDAGEISGNTSHPALRSATADSQAAPAPRRRGRKPLPKSVPTPSESRLLELLDRPRRGRDLAPLLGVTHERVRQMIATLLERDFIRSGDPETPTSIIELKQDPSLLLRLEQERLLNRFPEAKATTLSRIVNLGHLSKAKITAIAATLLQAGLIEKAGASSLGELYRLTPAGAGHWQRSATVIQADAPPPPPLPVRSGRVRCVLADLESHGPTRTKDIGLRLGIPQPSINALMQYLKRKRLVSNQTDDRWAPYALTAEGRDTLAALLRKAKLPSSGRENLERQYQAP
jgi:DNA-binding MarR family transcriptional regulator